MSHGLTNNGGPLKILHVLRAPLGGLFRHVVDLSREQIRRGHAVGLIADASTGGDAAEKVLSELAPALALGLSRVPMRREPHPSDWSVLIHALARAAATQPDVIHGHGSKGGLFARLPGFIPGIGRSVRVYTPHGGSLNHKPGSASNRVYMRVERVLALRTDLLLFESSFIADRYRILVGPSHGLSRVVHNGIGKDEFAPVPPRPDMAEFLYVGELRAAKGIDVLLEALAIVGRAQGRVPRAVLVGSGPDKEALIAHARKLGLQGHVDFAGPMPARQAFALGQILVVPSRAESLPYIALEAAGARVPLIATAVGGIPEIFGPYSARLIPADDVPRLAGRMTEVLSAPPDARMAEAEDLARFVQRGFSITAMADAVVDAYRDALARKRPADVLPRDEIAVAS